MSESTGLSQDRTELQQRTGCARGGGHLDHGRMSGLIARDAQRYVAGRTGFDRARFFVMSEVVEGQCLGVYVRSATGHGGDQLDPEGLGEPHVFVAAIGGVGGHLSRDQSLLYRPLYSMASIPASFKITAPRPCTKGLGSIIP